MANHGWHYLKALQDATRDGYNSLVVKRREPRIETAVEMAMDIVMVAIGLLIYVQFDLHAIFPISLPDNWKFFEPVVASIGLAIFAYGGISLVVALVEMIIWKIKELLSKKPEDF